MDVGQLTFVGLVAFGGTWFVNEVYHRIKNEDLPSAEKFIVSAVIALIVAFIPADLQAFWLTQIKNAIEVASAVAGVYQGVGMTAKKLAGTK